MHYILWPLYLQIEYIVMFEALCGFQGLLAEGAGLEVDTRHLPTSAPAAGTAQQRARGEATLQAAEIRVTDLVHMTWLAVYLRK